MRCLCIQTLALALLLATGFTAQKRDEQNGSPADAEWRPLFDGETLNGWRGVNRPTPPDAWQVIDGVLVCRPEGHAAKEAGDLLSIEQFGNFELAFEWRMTPRGGNSGVKYFVVEALSSGSAGIGLEYQLLQGIQAAIVGEKHRTAALYDLLEAKNSEPKPLGEWNSSRIIAQGRYVEHWLNGVKVLEFERGSDEFRRRVAESKFKDYRLFGEAEKGHILLQDHGGTVMFRNLKIRTF
ncbi:MAG: DUF1080 domain-containing protein [candidate division KSB1 bacterium]|nr:DUF1080 domain-containing protein [candidate division KSB1 bacterium]